MSRTAQISKEKQQSIITLRHEGQSMRKISRTLKVQLQKPSSTMMKLSLMRTATGKEEVQLELPASEIADQINASQSSRNRHLNINCLSWSNCCKGTTTKGLQ
jgi:hypothetical protein